jgi:HK97 gp10 family phage protein
MIDARLQAELNQVISRLKKLEPGVRKGAQKDLEEASKILVAAVKGKTPIGDKIHKRYSRLRPGQKKAAKDQGKVIARYKPGNLQRSIKTLKFRRSEAVFVGPKLGGKASDGYYAHFVEDGTKFQTSQKFVAAAVASAGSQTLKAASALIARRIDAIARQNGFNK